MARKLILFFVLFFAIERFCHWQTGGFQIHKIMSPISFEWEEPPLSIDERANIEKILDQPFFYLGRGTQTYAFESSDGLTVLKFIKHTRKKRLKTLFSSCQLAYEKNKKESGLIYAHLQAKPVWNKKVKVIDNIGIEHAIDIDQTTFLLQKKAQPLCSHLDYSTLTAFVSHVQSRCKNRIANHDAVERNYGIVDGEVIDIDVGSLYPLRGLRQKQIFYELLPLRAYLQQNRPDLLTYFDEKAKMALL
jgi:hypothetical protein